MTKPDPIKRWIQLESNLYKSPLGNYGGNLDGPFDEQSLLVRVNELLNPQLDDHFDVTTKAKVIRVEVGAGHMYARSDGRFVATEKIKGLPSLPLLKGSFRLVDKPLEGYLVFSKSLDQLRLEEFLDKSKVRNSGDASELLVSVSRSRWSNAIVIEATLTPGEEIGVDVEKIAKVVPPKGGQSHLPYLPEPPLPRSGRVVEGKQIVGFRTWFMHVPSILVAGLLLDDEPRLIGPTYDQQMHQTSMYVWRDAEVRARCKYRDHAAPAIDCDCGLYAYHTWRYGKQYYQGISPASTGAMVKGAVLGSGDVFVYDLGWRAEVANVIALSSDSVDERYMPGLRRIAAKFDVPIVSAAQLQEIAAKKGRSLSKAQLEGID